MKKIIKISFVLLALIVLFVFLPVVSYFVFPEILFNLVVTAGRHSVGLVKKEIQVDDHKIVYLEGGEGKQYYCFMALVLIKTPGYDLQST